jgi:hypothetical protein
LETNISKFVDDLKKLIDKSELLYYSLVKEMELGSQEIKKKLKEMKLPSFKSEYEIWYSESLAIIKLLLPDRLSDFSTLYRNDKRKDVDFLTYTISDYMLGLRTTRGLEVKADGKAAVPKFEQQKNILKSVERKLTQVTVNHEIKISKKNPSIGDINDLLKNNEIIEVPTWRFIQHLGTLEIFVTIAKIENHRKRK